MGILKELMGFRKWIKTIEPKSSFNESKVPQAPDYNDLEYWAAHPEKESKVFLRPDGVGNDNSSLEADTFYIHPTSYFGADNWNEDFSSPQVQELINEGIIVSQASVFNGCSRIFAPRYRQATFYTFIKNTKSGRKAMELAYTDVLNAFEHFLKYENKGRPFFIASHSQGTCHAMRLLEEYIDKHECVNRMVAAYAIGFQFPEEKFTSGQFENMHICESPTDTQCVIAYDTYLETGKPAHLFDKAEIYYPNKKKWVKRANKKVVGVNPVTWTRATGKIAPHENYKGGLILKQAHPEKVNPKAFGTKELMNLDTIGILPPVMEKLSMEIRKDGFLYVSKPISPFLRRLMLPGGNLHNYDYSLFYMNIRENTQQRLAAFQAKNRT